MLLPVGSGGQVAGGLDSTKGAEMPPADSLWLLFSKSPSFPPPSWHEFASVQTGGRWGLWGRARQDTAASLCSEGQGFGCHPGFGIPLSVFRASRWGWPSKPHCLGVLVESTHWSGGRGESRTEQACLGLPHDLEPLAQGAFPSSAASGPCSHSRAPPLLSQLRACTVEGLALRPFRSLPHGHTAAPVPTDFIETPVSPVTLALRPLPSLSRIPSRASQFRLCAQGRPV